MSEHLDTYGLELFIAHKLAPDDLLRAARHVGVCQSCRERIATARGTSGLIASLGGELRLDADSLQPHLDYKQLEAYVDDRLDAVAREILENHLGICPTCAKELAELELFKEDLTAPPPASVPSENLWHRFRDALRLPPRIAWAGALLIVIAAAVILLLWQRGRTPQIANHNNNTSPEMVNNLGRNPPEVVNRVNRNPPDVVNNRNVNVNTNRGESPQLDSNVNATGGVGPYEAVIKRALESQTIDRAPVLSELAGRPSSLMGKSEGETFALLQPVGTVTLSNRPTFTWQALAGATSYQVDVLDTGFNVVAESPPLTATSWSPPAGLKSGTVYLWQVSAARGGEVISAPTAPRPEARFMILTASRSREVKHAVNERASSHQAQGIIYAHNGLLDDAEREFRAALSQPEEAATARRLLQSVNALRH